MTPTNATIVPAANANANNKSITARLTGDWALFGAVTSLLMWHNGQTTYHRVSGHAANVSANGLDFVALAEAVVTVAVIECTSAYFLSTRKTESNPIRQKIAAWGVVIPLVISGVINLNIDPRIADFASRVATMSCAAIVAAWHWYATHESPIEALKAEIKALAEKLQLTTRERDAALAQAQAASTGNNRAGEMIRMLQSDIEIMRRDHAAALATLTAQYHDEIDRLTQHHTVTLAAAKSNATANASANVTVNVANVTAAQPVSANVQPLASVSAPLALTEESLALTIAERRANGENVSSVLLANLFGVSQSRIRQMAAWANREVIA